MYELGFYIQGDDILHRHRRETSNLTNPSTVIVVTAVEAVEL
jgi:hypothetical protein